MLFTFEVFLLSKSMHKDKIIPVVRTVIWIKPFYIKYVLLTLSNAIYNTFAMYIFRYKHI